MAVPSACKHGLGRGVGTCASSHPERAQAVVILMTQRSRGVPRVCSNVGWSVGKGSGRCCEGSKRGGPHHHRKVEGGLQVQTAACRMWKTWLAQIAIDSLSSGHQSIEVGPLGSEMMASMTARRMAKGYTRCGGNMAVMSTISRVDRSGQARHPSIPKASGLCYMRFQSGGTAAT